jgi:dienelactone hydrolase
MEQRIFKHKEVAIDIGHVRLAGDLALPGNAKGLVVFAHGSGSSRFSKRNRYVADVLNQAELATLLFDLLTADEEAIDERTRELRFDIGLLSQRLIGAVDWLSQHHFLRDLSIGLFGASTGAAAALNTAAARPEQVAAVVSRGGRPDLAAEALPHVRSPVLLIVGGHDQTVLQLNQQAAAQLRAARKLSIVAGATHLFEEPGKLEEVAKLACNWFQQYLITHERLTPRCDGGKVK